MDALLTDTNMKLIEHIRLVCKRPGMYMNPVNLDSLSNFINGYTLCATIDNKRTDLFRVGEPSFEDWVLKKLNIRKTSENNWVWALAMAQEGRNADISIFIEYFEEYCSVYFQKK